MLIYVFGATASGKSEIAEEMACSLKGEKIYLATMENVGTEAEERIKKHRKQRSGRGFETIEQPSRLKTLKICNKVILLECIGNLLANTMFDSETPKQKEQSVEAVMEEIRYLRANNELIVVGNDVFGEDIFFEGKYDDLTQTYIQALKEIHEQLLAESERCVEVVCKIAIERMKG